MAKQTDNPATPAMAPVMVPIATITRNKKNYREHPRAQVEQIEHSLREFGQYKPVVLSRDSILIAGHGVLEGAIAEGRTEVAAVYMPFLADDPLADKLLIADNELYRQAEDNDRALTNLLKELSESEVGLDGTGFDEMMLANLVMVTRPESEIADFDAAKEWVGMPGMGEAERKTRVQLIVWCDTEEERNDALQLLEVDVVAKNRATVSIHWPAKDREVREDSSLEWVEGE